MHASNGCALLLSRQFYQIATKVDEVYGVSLPAAVKEILDLFYVTTSFGLGSISSVYDCLGLYSFLHRLIFWMILPPVLVLVVLLFGVVQRIATCSLTRGPVLEWALPLILRLFFILYPLVTNVAFEVRACPAGVCARASVPGPKTGERHGFSCGHPSAGLLVLPIRQW